MNPTKGPPPAREIAAFRLASPQSQRSRRRRPQALHRVCLSRVRDCTWAAVTGRVNAQRLRKCCSFCVDFVARSRRIGATRQVSHFFPEGLLHGFQPVSRGGVVCLAAVAGGVATSGLIPPSFALTNNGSITDLDTPFTENFDSLASTGTTIDLDGQRHHPRLVSRRARPTTRARESSNAGALYSFGVAGTNPVTDRALGSIGSGSDGQRSTLRCDDEQHRRNDHLAGRQLRRRAVAQRRQRNTGRSSLRCQYSRRCRRDHRRDAPKRAVGAS